MGHAAARTTTASAGDRGLREAHHARRRPSSSGQSMPCAPGCDNARASVGEFTRYRYRRSAHLVATMRIFNKGVKILARSRRRLNLGGSANASHSAPASNHGWNGRYEPRAPTCNLIFEKPTCRNKAVSSEVVYSFKWKPVASSSKPREMSCGPVIRFGVMQI